MTIRDYPVVIFWDEGAYVAVPPDLPGCSAIGDTEAEALEELHTAIALWLKAAENRGSLIPRPSSGKAFIERMAA